MHSELYSRIVFLIYFLKKNRPKVVFYNRKKSSRETTSDRARKKCSRGDQCTFAHDESQLRGKPDLAGDFRDHLKWGISYGGFEWYACIKLKQWYQMISDDIRWYQMISDDFSDASVLSSSNVSVSKMNQTKIQFVLPGTKLCRFYAAGQPCRYGSKCTHSHGPDSGYGSQGSQAAPKDWQSYLLPKDLIWSHLIFQKWINQQRNPGPAPHLWYRDVNTLTVWFQLEEKDPIGGKGSKFVPHVSKKKGLRWKQSYWNSPTHPPAFFQGSKPKGQK